MEAIGNRIQAFLKQNKYVVIVVVLGIGLMLLPGKASEGTEKTETIVQTPKADMESRMEQILSQIEGVGRIRVLLTIAEGERMIYEWDEDRSETETGMDLRKEVVLVTDSARDQTGLVRQVMGPVFRGAVVVCQGGDLPAVRLAIVEAVANATGLSTDRISVLKMK